MFSVLKTAWRVVARRAFADRAVLSAAFLSVLFAITLVAAGPSYSDAVTVSSLRRSLQDAPLIDANVSITTRVEPATFEADDSRIRSGAADTFSAIGAVVYGRGTSDSYSSADLAGDHSGDILLFRFFEDVGERVEVVAGRWPSDGSPVVEAAVSQPAAAVLGLEPGSRLVVESRRHPDETWPVEITGVYRVIDPEDPYWLEDELDVTGISEGVGFTTVGPFVVTPETYFATVAAGTSGSRWAVFPNHESIEIADVAPTASRLYRLEDDLNVGRELSNQVRVESGLTSLLWEADRSLLVTRSGVLVVFIQLALLAAYSLVLTAGLLADSREVETVTLRSRGADNGQILGMSVMEGILVIAPALAAGPFLATAALRGLNHAGPLAAIGLDIDPRVTATGWTLAGFAAVACLIALVVPAHLSARRFGDVRARRSRQTGASLARRGGADLALLAVAAIGMWQLARYGGTITSTLRGRLGVDPLLVAAPALALLAGAVLSLRALPLLARTAEGAIGRGRPLLPGLGVWYLGRQPRRYARSALLLTLALAIGFFALSYDTTWRRSQSDQAGFQVGADVRVDPARQAGSIPPEFLRNSYEALPGFEEAVPLVEAPGQIPGASLPIRYIALDSRRAAGTLRFRSDLADRPLAEMMSELASHRAELSGLALEGRPSEVSALVTAEVVLPEEAVERGVPETVYGFDASLRMVLVDGDGQIYRVDLGDLHPTGAMYLRTAALRFTDATGAEIDPVYPLRVYGVEVRALAPLQPWSVGARVSVSDLRYGDGESWTPLALGSNGFETAISDLRRPFEEPSMTAEVTDVGFAVELNTGSTSNQVRDLIHFSVATAPPAGIDPLPVLASADLIDELGVGIGAEIPLNGLPQYAGTGQIVGSFDAFPTVRPDEGYGVVVDYQTYLAATHGPGVNPTSPDAYLLAVDDGRVDAATGRLSAPPFSSADVVSASERAAALSLDPTSLGMLGSLTMGLVAASVLAAIGFVVNSTVTTRERLGQFAVLRAVGLSSRQLVAWIGIETGMVVVFGIVAGIGLGFLLSAVALPLVTVTQEASSVVPPLIVGHPWLALTVVVSALLAALAFGMSLVSRIVRGLDMAGLLRRGDE
jgi:hypothetical protein